MPNHEASRTKIPYKELNEDGVEIKFLAFGDHDIPIRNGLHKCIC